MATYTSNFGLQKDASTDYYNIDTVNANLDKIDKALGNTAMFEKAGGTATAITLTGIEFVDGRSKTFIVTANNNGANTTINGKPLYKPGTTTAPKLIAGKAVTVWYDAAGDCFFIKASASGTATPSDVLAGVPFSNEDGEQVGTMPNNGAVSYTLPINGTYSIPAGYHNGNGKVTQSIPTKAAATYIPGTTDQVIAAGQYLVGNQIIKGDPNLTPPNIPEGKTIFGVAGTAKVVTECAQISNLQLTAPAEGGKLIATWTNPSDGKIKGVRIMYKTGGYPTSPSDGSVFYDSNDGAIATTTTVTGLTNGTTYYVRAFAYTYQNATRLYTTTTAGAQASATPLNTQGQQIFTSSGIFTVPAGVYTIQVFVVGGGGGGGGGDFYVSESSGGGYVKSGGGGGGGYTKYGTYNVTPGTQYAVVVGAGGAGGSSSSKGGDGGTSSFGSLLSASGGKGAVLQEGGNGGSGGGVGYYAYGSGSSSNQYNATAGGSNGSDGGYSAGGTAGKGQGTTTRAFGETSGTLYAGGGGGGGSGTNSGGAGGGGNGSSDDSAATPGAVNTGGGGGGGSTGASGGSGIVIVRWGY